MSNGTPADASKGTPADASKGHAGGREQGRDGGREPGRAADVNRVGPVDVSMRSRVALRDEQGLRASR